LADISKFYPELLARDKILFSDVLVASRILIGLKGTFKISGKPSGDRKSIIALKYLLSQSKFYLPRGHQRIVFYPEPEARDKIY
jgi:hypothetical protein